MVTERFVGLARGVAKGRQVPDLPMVILPAEMEQMTRAELEVVARNALDDAQRVLTATAGSAMERTA